MPTEHRSRDVHPAKDCFGEGTVLRYGLNRSIEFGIRDTHGREIRRQGDGARLRTLRFEMGEEFPDCLSQRVGIADLDTRCLRESLACIRFGELEHQSVGAKAGDVD